MIRFLLDEGLPCQAAAELRGLGFDSSHALEAGLGGQPDLRLLLQAQEEGRVLVTLDADFSHLLATSRREAPSVLFLRMQGLDRSRTVFLLSNLPAVVMDRLEQGAVVSASEHGFRIRKLPLPDPFK